MVVGMVHACLDELGPCCMLSTGVTCLPMVSSMSVRAILFPER